MLTEDEKVGEESSWWPGSHVLAERALSEGARPMRAVHGSPAIASGESGKGGRIVRATRGSKSPSPGHRARFGVAGLGG